MKKISPSKLTLLIFFAVIFIGSIALAIVSRNTGGENIAVETDTQTSSETEVTDGSDSSETTTATMTEITTSTSFMTYLFYDYHDERTQTGGDEEPSQTGFDDEPVYTEEVITSRDVINYRDRSYFGTYSSYIDMENIRQLPELPTGCEITALTILLRHYGFPADKTDLARNYLPTSWGNAREVDGVLYKDSFYDYFIGDPFSTGYGCFSGAIETAADSYISSHGGGFDVRNISGCSPDTLYDWVASGVPVLCWATDGMIAPEYYETWYDNATGERLDWYLNEHCFVLAGYDVDAGTVTLNDPMKGIISYDINKFETRFAQMHSQAIVLIPYTENGEFEEYDPEETEETTAAETTAETAAPTEAAATDAQTSDDFDVFTFGGGEGDIDIWEEPGTIGSTGSSDIFQDDIPTFEDIQ